MSFWDELLPASFRQVPFKSEGASGRFGRRVAMHEYPFRDEPYPEDMGRAARRYRVRGFLVGDDVIAQRKLLQGAVETAGPGELIHPTYGSKSVVVLEFEINEHRDRGRYFEFEMIAVEAGKRIFPSTTPDTGGNVCNAADSADSAVTSDFSAQISSSGALQDGALSVSQATTAAQSWSNSASQQVSGATALYSAVAALPGAYGRYAGTNTPAAPNSATLNSLIAQGVQSRVQVGQAGNALVSAGARMGL